MTEKTPFPLTKLEIDLVLEEVSVRFDGATVQRFYEQRPGTFVLQTRRRGKTDLTLFSVARDLGRIHAVQSKPRQPAHPTSFTMLVRKVFVGTTLAGIRRLESDRIVIVEACRTVEAEGRPLRSQLVLEWTGREGRAFVLDEEERILGVTTPDASRLTGSFYVRPPVPVSVRAPSPPRWGLGALEPSVRSSTLADLAERFVSGLKHAQRRQALHRLLVRRQRKLKRRLAAIDKDLKRAEAATRYRKWAELLQGVYGAVGKGAKSAVATDYYDPELSQVTVPLDPSRSLADNIQTYFRQYRRLHSACEGIRKRHQETQEELGCVLTAFEELENALDSELSRLEERLFSERILHRPRAQEGRKKALVKSPYRTFSTARGGVVLVGRSAKGNDELTRRHARGRDIWMHARDFSGAHVVLRQEKGSEPDSADLMDAAILAGHFSKGRAEAYVDVTYTHAKYVSKPKGAPTGMVQVGGGSTLCVRLDKERIRLLIETENTSISGG